MNLASLNFTFTYNTKSALLVTSTTVANLKRLSTSLPSFISHFSPIMASKMEKSPS